MIQIKICLLGARGAGKRTILSKFDQTPSAGNYRAAISVQIATKTIQVGEQSIKMVVWDVTDHEDFEQVAIEYLRGMSGYLLIADGTRPATLERARQIYEQIYSLEQAPPSEPNASVPYVQFPFRKIPFVLLLNKSDLIEEWKFKDSDLERLVSKGWPVLKSSAKENSGVEEAFLSIAQKILS